MILSRIELTQLEERIRLQAYNECFDKPIIDVEIDSFSSTRFRKTLKSENNCVIEGSSVQESELIFDKTVRDGDVNLRAELIHERLED